MQKAVRGGSRPNVHTLRKRMARVFDDAAEAFVLLDVNAGGGLSQSELARGLHRLGIKDVNADALFDELRLTDDSELDAYDFIRYLKWHPDALFPEGSWQEGLVLAMRQRRRIMSKFYERSKTGTTSTTDRLPTPDSRGAARRSRNSTAVLKHDLAIRANRVKNFERVVKASQGNKDTSYGAASNQLLWLHGGMQYESLSDLREGTPVSKLPMTHGLPGASPPFNPQKISSRLFELNVTTKAKFVQRPRTSLN